MQAQPSARPRRRKTGDVYTVLGYGIRIRVERGHLTVTHGIGQHREHARFNRATSRLYRLVVVGSTGYITIEALRWMHHTGCALIHLDHTGDVIATSSPLGNDHPALRRAQALAATRAVGLEISRRLLGTKLAGQADVAGTIDADAANTIRAHAARLDQAEDLAELRLIEAHAAVVYWSAWRGVQPTYATRDSDRIPDHWRRFSQRVSPLTATPRTAADPINAILNYLYGLLEAEARIALTAVGLDPGLGILHTDQRARDSLALDLMEAARPAVDEHVLDLAAHRPVRAADFAETRSGQCRIMPTLTRELADTSGAWAGAIAPHAEAIARLLAADAGLAPAPTILTEATRRTAHPAARPTPKPRQSVPRSACVDCGMPIRYGQRRCADCHTAANAERLPNIGRREIERRRADGEHPTQAADVRERIGAKQRSQWQARRTTELIGGFTGQSSEFRHLILPKLMGTRPADLARATGLSRGYCAQIRDGKRIPHVRHWAAFQLAGLVT